MINKNIKDIAEIIEVSKEEIENNKDISAVLDLQDLKSLKYLFDSYNYIIDKMKEVRDKAEVMDYYNLTNVIDDLTKCINYIEGVSLEEEQDD